VKLDAARWICIPVCAFLALVSSSTLREKGAVVVAKKLTCCGPPSSLSKLFFSEIRHVKSFDRSRITGTGTKVVSTFKRLVRVDYCRKVPLQAAWDLVRISLHLGQTCPEAEKH